MGKIDTACLKDNPLNELGDLVPLGARVYNIIREFEKKGDKQLEKSFYVEYDGGIYGYCRASIETLGEFLGAGPGDVKRSIYNYASRYGLLVSIKIPCEPGRRWMSTVQALRFINGLDLTNQDRVAHASALLAKWAVKHNSVIANEVLLNVSTA